MTKAEGDELRRRLNTTDLAIEIGATSGRVAPGERPAYMLTVRNDGPNASSSTVVSARLSGLAHWIESPPECRTSSPQGLDCELGELASHTHRSIALTAQTGDMESTVSVSADVQNRFGPDADAADNSATAETLVRK